LAQDANGFVVGLSPGVPISVEPRGTPPPPPLFVGRDVPNIDPAPDVGVPAATQFAAVESAVPPPSNVDVDPDAAGLQVCAIIGLKPPGLSSVEPSGIPDIGVAELDGRVPNGDVCPMPEVVPGVVPTCAKLGLQVNIQTIATKLRVRRITHSIYFAAQVKRLTLQKINGHPAAPRATRRQLNDSSHVEVPIWDTQRAIRSCEQTLQSRC
jgi:hypothetical protein